MNPRRIVIDGKTYHSLNEMPADVRARYEQALRSLKDQDGKRVPDALEGNNLLVDGQEYNSLDDLPPEVRARYELAMGALDANRNGIPDFVEGMVGTHSGMSHVANNQTNHTLHHAPRTPMPVSPVITPDTSNGWIFALLGAFLLFLCAAGALGVWYFLFR